MSIEKVTNDVYSIGIEFLNISPFILTYVLLGENIAIIDPGPASTIEDVLVGLNKLGIQRNEVDYILVTHVHLDHAGSVGKLSKFLPNAKVITHEKGKPHLVNPDKLWKSSREVLKEYADAYGRPEPVPAERIDVMTEGAMIRIGKDMELEVLDTVGHASHELSFFEKKNGIIFLGDTGGTYFKDLDFILPSTPPPFHLEKAIRSIEKLIALRPSIACYAHHGFSTNAVDKLSSYKKIMLDWAREIAEKWKRKLTPSEILHEIKEKNEIASVLSRLTGPMYRMAKFYMLVNILGFITYFDKYGIKVPV